MNVLAKIKALAPEISERAADIEAARRLPRDLADKLSATGAFRMLVPKDLGGMEAEPMAALEVIEAAARADSSTGWCVMIASTTSATSAFLPPEIGREIYGTSDAITGGVFAPMGKAVLEGEHYRVNGHWNWASGSTHCTWLMGGCVILEDGKPRMLPNGAPDGRMMIFPASEVELPDTWHVTGQAGTGSGEMIARDVMVPRSRSVSLMSDKPQYPGPLYVFPIFGLLSLGIASVALGSARGAMDDFLELAKTKFKKGGARVQAEVAQAEATLSASRAFMKSEVEQAYELAATSGEMTIETRARLRLAATHAVRTSADVTRSLYDLGGGSSVYLSSPLQRRFRDAHVATAHIMTAPATYELTGRVLMGLETDATFL